MSRLEGKRLPGGGVAYTFNGKPLKVDIAYARSRPAPAPPVDPVPWIEHTDLIGTLSFAVPGRPVPKERTRTVRAKGVTRTFTPPRTVAYERHVATMATLALANYRRTNPPGFPVGARAFRLSCRIWRQRASGDLSNIIKAIEDGLNRVVWHDDARVVSYGPMELRVDRLQPRVEIVVEAFS